jgi:hypothetical protein
MIYVNHPKKSFRGKLHKAKGDCPDRVKSDQILGTVRRDAGLHDSKTKLAQGGPSHSSPLRSDGSLDGQLGDWTMFMAANGTQRKSWKTILVAKI